MKRFIFDDMRVTKLLCEDIRFADVNNVFDIASTFFEGIKLLRRKMLAFINNSIGPFSYFADNFVFALKWFICLLGEEARLYIAAFVLILFIPFARLFGLNSSPGKFSHTEA